MTLWHHSVDTDDYYWQITKLESWHWIVVTWTAFAFLAMFCLSSDFDIDLGGKISFTCCPKSDLILRLQKWPENECINVRIWAMSAETRGLPTGRVKWDGVVHAAHTKDYRPEINNQTYKDQQPYQIATKTWQPNINDQQTNKYRSTASQGLLPPNQI